MSESTLKPLDWQPEAGIGYTVQRRPDGGMHYVFTDVNEKTLRHWREFALKHLLDSDRLTRNLYDLRAVKKLPPQAVQVALELNTDPSARNIRVAVVVENDEVRRTIEEIDALSVPAGVELGIFTQIEEAETWLSRPLTQLI